MTAKSAEKGNKKNSKTTAHCGEGPNCLLKYSCFEGQIVQKNIWLRVLKVHYLYKASHYSWIFLLEVKLNE